MAWERTNSWLSASLNLAFKALEGLSKYVFVRLYLHLVVHVYIYKYIYIIHMYDVHVHICMVTDQRLSCMLSRVTRKTRTKQDLSPTLVVGDDGVPFLEP